jgi:hypothetical protein
VVHGRMSATSSGGGGSTGGDSRLSNCSDEDWLEIVNSLERYAKTTLGIHGKHLWVTTNDGTGCIAASSSLFLDNLRTVKLASNFTCPTVAVDIISLFLRSSSDGGWAAIFLFAQLIKAAFLYGRRLHKGFSLALRLIGAYFHSEESDEIIKMDWADADMVHKVSCSVISTVTWLLKAEVTRLCDLMCIIASHAEETISGSISLPYVFYIIIPGISVRSSDLRPGAVLMEIPVPGCLTRAKTVENATIAIFDCSLEFAEVSDDMNISVIELNMRSADSMNMKHQEQQSLRKFMFSLIQSNICVLACQKRIHPHLQQLCRCAGIICLPRVSAKYIGALVRLTGARLLGSYTSVLVDGAPPLTSELGFLSKLKYESLFGKSYVLVSSTVDTSLRSELDQLAFVYRQSRHPSNCDDDEEAANKRAYEFAEGILLRRKPMVSVIICAPVESLAYELQRTLETCTRLLNNLLIDPRLLAGAGRWQFRAGLLLLKLYQKVSDRRGAVPSAAITSMMEAVVTETDDVLTENGRYGKLIASLLQDYSSELVDGSSLPGLLYFGNALIHLANLINGGHVRHEETLRCYDCLNSVMLSLHRSVETALSIHDIDGIISTRPRLSGVL